MTRVLKKLLPYAIILIVVFSILPIGMRMTNEAGLVFLFLYIVDPAICFGTGALWGIKHGFKWYFLLLAPVLFIPFVYLALNDSALPFAVVFMLLSAMGMGIGWVLRKLASNARPK